MSARRSGPIVSLGAAALPAVLWHRVIADIASQFRPEPTYLLTGRTGWVLMALGLACRITLYLLGFALATQVAQIADGLSAI